MAGQVEVIDPLASKRSGRRAAANESRRYVRVNFVDQALGEKRSLHLGASLNQQAGNAPLAQLLQQGWEVNATIRGGRQAEDLCGSDTPRSSGGDERIGADDPG